jgi:hypothetical protein
MLKKPASRVPAWRVIASLRGSTYRKEYDSPHRSLRPRWTAFLNILRVFPIQSATSAIACIQAVIMVFQQPASATPDENEWKHRFSAIDQATESD